MTWGFFVLVPAGYLLGSVPWGYLVARVARGVDIRQYGSGKTGVTNVLRTVGVWAALLVLAADVGKGAAAVLLARYLAHSQGVEVAAALATIAGHNWSPFLKFQGGRGIAPGVGGLFVISWLAATIGIAVFLPIVALSRYVSLGSVIGLTAGLLAALVLFLLGHISFTHFLHPLVGVPVIVLQHTGNIRRLLRGEERKIGQRAEPPATPRRAKGSEG